MNKKLRVKSLTKGPFGGDRKRDLIHGKDIGEYRRHERGEPYLIVLRSSRRTEEVI